MTDAAVQEASVQTEATTTTESAAPQAEATQAKAETTETKQAPANDFKIPDAYKDKPWTAKIKSQEDLYKQLDNLDSLVGKKGVIVPDFKTAKPEEIEGFFNGMRPQDKTAYKFGDEGTFDEKFTGSVADMLYDSGISEFQANKLIPAYQKLEKSRLEEATSADGFLKVMKDAYGDNFEAVVARGDAEFKNMISEKNLPLLDVMPNEYLPAIYDLNEAWAKKFEAFKKEHGVNENGDAHVEKGGNIVQDKEAMKSKIRAELKEMDKRPHTQQEKDAKVAELEKLYK